MKTRAHVLLTLTLITLLLAAGGCRQWDITGLDQARARIEPLVFADDLDDDVYFQAFMGTDIYAMELDSIFAYQGTRSIKITVPPEGSSQGGYAGGVLTSVAARDLADYNALTFYARSSVASTLNEAGFGNDNTGTSLFGASRANIPLDTDWTFVVIPIPSPDKLIAERGMFMMAEGWEDPAGHTLWFDEIRFAKLDNIADPFTILPSAFKQYFVGATAQITGTYTRYNIDGAFVIVNHSPNYLDFESTDPDVARVVKGEIQITGEGNATITASLSGVDAAGSVVLSGYLPPETPAPAPAELSSEVISLFCDAYSEDVVVDLWNPDWGQSTELADYAIDGDNMLMYSSLNWTGIDFLSHTVDLSDMSTLHVDVFAPAGTDFKVKLVAFDGDGGNLIDESELRFTSDTVPAFIAGQWSSLDIPLIDFEMTGVLEHIGQLVLSTGDARLVLVDNIYWSR